MPKECRRAPDGKPSPNNPDSCKDWNHCIHLRASSPADIANETSNETTIFSHEAYYEGLKKCIFHNGNWSVNGCSIETKNFLPVNDVDIDVNTVLEHIDTATLEVMQNIVQGQTGGLAPRTLDEHRVSPSVSAAYGIMAVSFLILLTWLLQRKRHCHNQ
ncbi:hypothetical protein EKO04_010427 [Ascochyta lentis]|uniref:Uncharacterized protein n=1 Tax=Ascochyta lentis TaxID=205686 RepID=A0A8H7IVJ6_9PLEO|nr:hypothetical protein EKO04_010427 [Ascochyta lentis]